LQRRHFSSTPPATSRASRLPQSHRTSSLEPQMLASPRPEIALGKLRCICVIEIDFQFHVKLDFGLAHRAARDAQSVGPMLESEGATAISSALRRQLVISDRCFDRLFPKEQRSRSPFHWTPVAVAFRACALLAPEHDFRVLDVGSGVGNSVSSGPQARRPCGWASRPMPSMPQAYGVAPRARSTGTCLHSHFASRARRGERSRSRVSPRTRRANAVAPNCFEEDREANGHPPAMR